MSDFHPLTAYGPAGILPAGPFFFLEVANGFA